MSGAVSVLATDARGGNAQTPKTSDKLCRLPFVKGVAGRFSASDGAELVGAIAGKCRVGVLLANTFRDRKSASYRGGAA
jgi:hypothetical protein